MKEIISITLNISCLLCVIAIFTSAIVAAITNKEGIKDKAFKVFGASFILYFAFLLGYLITK